MIEQAESFGRRFKKAVSKTIHGEYFYLIWAFIIPAMIMWVIYMAILVYPIGDNSVLVLDLNGQYVSFFEYLRSKVLNGGSLVYSWERALGGEFLGIFAYYIASPLSLLVALFPEGSMTEALLVLFLLKTGLCGLTMGIYLHLTNPERNRIGIVIFSTMYALTAYAVVQQHNTMWIDELFILPMLVYGIEQLIRNRRYKLYTVMLALAVYTNFYIGFMMCIFTFFYFFYYFFGYREKTFKFWSSLWRIGVFTVIALCIASIILLPALYSLTFGKTTFSDPSFAVEQRFDFLDMTAKLFPGSYDTVRPEGLPFIYCGTLALILLPVYFISSNVKPRHKIFGGLAIAFFVFCFNTSTIDIVWHGFQKPNWLNYRYSFMFCFFVIVFAYKAFENIQQINYKYIVSVCCFLGILLMVIQKQDYEWIDDFKCIWVSIGFLAGYIVLLYIVSKNLIKQAGRIVLLAFVCLEMFSAGLLNVLALDKDVVYTSRKTYVTYMDKIRPSINHIKELDTSFYRMEKNFQRKTNDPMALGYKGLSNSTSTLNASVIKFLNQMGLASKSHWSKYFGGNPVTDSLLALKYVIYEGDAEEGTTGCTNELYNLIYTDEEHSVYAYENPYVLSIAYAVNEAVAELDFDEYLMPFDLMNDMVTAMLGSEETIRLFVEIPKKSIENKKVNIETSYVTEHYKYTPENDTGKGKMYFTFNAPTEDEIFMFVPTGYPREGKLKLNGKDWGSILGNNSDCIVSIGKFEKDEEIAVSMTLEEDLMYISTKGDSFFYYLDTELFKEIMPRLAESLYTVTDYSDTMLEGAITVPNGRALLFTTIPYDESWKVTIDGENAEIVKTADALLAVNITEGEHFIKFEYRSKYVKWGTILSCSGLAVFAIICAVKSVCMLIKKKTGGEPENKITEDNEINLN